jgi:two-component system NtrC family sensor kinase
MLTRVTNYFLPAGFGGSPDEQRQARTIVNTVAVTSLFSANFLLLCWWGHFWPGIYLMLFNVGAFVVLLFCYRQGLFSYAVLGYLYLAAGYLGVFLNCVYQGGYYAATTPWLVLCPVVGTFLLGWRGGLSAGTVALLSIGGLWELERRHLVLPNSVPPAKALFWHLDVLMGLLLILLLVALVFDRIYSATLEQLTEKNTLLAQRTEQLEQALRLLNEAQARLVHSEKMASLGELMAGIAHEIQNPLNFINNYAEINNELLRELPAGTLDQLPPTEREYLQDLLDTLTRNLGTIVRHGQRTDNIVRNMLQHAHTGPRERQPTNLNQLVTEYLLLAYAGLRAKEPAFQAQLHTQLDPAVGEIDVVASDLGRVLLNLFSNALYATAERQRQEPAGRYQAQLTVSSQRLPTQVELRVRDNGSGMPEAVRQKVFQPFFTTKAAGTGLGLSLSHDIVVKGHGGQLLVTSQEGEGTEFRLLLPV